MLFTQYKLQRVLSDNVIADYNAENLPCQNTRQSWAERNVCGVLINFSDIYKYTHVTDEPIPKFIPTKDKKWATETRSEIKDIKFYDIQRVRI